GRWHLPRRRRARRATAATPPRSASASARWPGRRPPARPTAAIIMGRATTAATPTSRATPTTMMSRRATSIPARTSITAMTGSATARCRRRRTGSEPATSSSAGEHEGGPAQPALYFVPLQPGKPVERALQDEGCGVLIDHRGALLAADVGGDQIALDGGGRQALVPQRDRQFRQPGEVAGKGAGRLRARSL